MNSKSFPAIDLAATGRNISALRKARGLSVSDLQEFFGFEAPQAIYKWQRGACLPSTDNLYALSVLLGVSIEHIIIPVQRRDAKLPRETSRGSGRFGVCFLLFRLHGLPRRFRLTAPAGTSPPHPPRVRSMPAGTGDTRCRHPGPRSGSRPKSPYGS